MKYIEYKEHRSHGQATFPVAYYHVTPMSPRYEMPLHWHPYSEIIYIHSGSMTLSINEQSYRCPAGSVVYISGGYLHGGIPDNCIYDCIVYDDKFFLQPLASRVKGIQDILTHRHVIHTMLSEHFSEASPILCKIVSYLSARSTGYELFVHSCFFELYGQILKKHLYCENEDSSMSSDRMQAIKDVLSYISDHYGEAVTLDDLAKIAGMNPKYFCRYFRLITDRTPIDYLNYYRIESACEMLSTQDKPIKEVAISCGFNDQSYFIKTFHKYKGLTPKQYLKNTFL